MRDLESLQSRIAHAQEKLDATQKTFDREDSALVEHWHSIRHQFEARNEEVQTLRAKVARLEQSNDSLGNMVESLLGSVESHAGAWKSRAVSDVSGMVDDLLQSAEGPADPDMPEQPAANQLEANSSPEFAEIAEPAETANFTDETSSDEALSADDIVRLLDEEESESDEADEGGTDSSVPDDGLSIRDLVSRVQDSFGDLEDTPVPDEPSSTEMVDESVEDQPNEAPELAALREELEGLQGRLSAQDA